VCDREKAGFNIRPAALNPLPIKGLGYRWHTDLAGPLAESPDGFCYAMICIEAFTKWIEVIPLRDKQSATTWHAFLSNVLARFGACAEVVTDQGTEFEGDFADGLVAAGIDHRKTSRMHPQADGLAERCVQTVKSCIRRTSERDVAGWPLALPWIVMGYRMSPQASLRFSPYYLLYGRQPVVPPAIRERLAQPINFDDPDAAMRSVIERGTLFRHIMPMALENLAVAQHRDTLRYATVHSGGYRPAVHDLHEGDFVYIRAPGSQDNNTLALSVSPDVFRVVEVRDTGVAILQGRDGRTMPENVHNCAPCHLSGIDGTVDPSLVPFDRGTVEIPCEVCNSIEHDPSRRMIMLLCDHCNTGWHTACLDPPLRAAPRGDWFCPYCVRLQRTWRVVAATFAQFQDGAHAPAYDTPEDVLCALERLMPGPWTQAHATRLYNCMPGRKNFVQLTTGGPERVLTTPAEYDVLLRYTDLSQVRCAWDPWCGTGSTAHRLREHAHSAHVHTILSDVDPSVAADHYGDALDPRFLHGIQEIYRRVDVFVTSPWFTMLDLTIPLMTSIATTAVFCHIPGHYLTNMPLARQAWFRANAARIHILSNLPVGPYGRRCAWLCWFRTAADMARVLSPAAREAPTVPVIV
jgi:hypothetical protein